MGKDITNDNEGATSDAKPSYLLNISDALPAQSGYEKGYRDALEAITLALGQSVAGDVLKEAVTTSLDAYANNAYDEADLVHVTLNSRDTSGSVVDSTSMPLLTAQVSEIVDLACDVILLRRDGEIAESALDALEESLVAADVIEKADAPSEAVRG